MNTEIITTYRQLFDKLQVNFIESWRYRVSMILVVVVLVIILHLSISFSSKLIEHDSIRRSLDEIITYENTFNIMVSPSHSRYRYDKLRNKIRVNRKTCIDVLVIEADIRKGKMSVAAEENGKVLNWQWDWRLLESKKLGKNYFILHVPSNMYRKYYNVQLIYKNENVSIKNIYLLELTSKDNWKSLLYNDVFFFKNKLLTPMRSSGYGISPRKLTYAFDERTS